ncbi:MAG: peptide deformylase [Fusobacterium gastrosuis]|uniref:peptide deformylase n=1 Tax=Fusobacterium gastrosuis TaxID=1755100 RepID=UPI002A8DF6FB|nr:peptide deformylase [Fusobacterium gastrosuis]
MVYEIKKYGEAVLKEVAKEVELSEFNDEFRKFLDDMVETMYVTDGIGLAAPQIGVSKRIFVCDNGEGVVRKVINPVITPLTTDKQEFEEGCLSVPGIFKKVERPKKIHIKYLNENAEIIEEEVDEFLAVVMQHEFDHLEGILFVERVSPMAKRMIAKKLQIIKKETLKGIE